MVKTLDQPTPLLISDGIWGVVPRKSGLRLLAPCIDAFKYDSN